VERQGRSRKGAGYAGKCAARVKDDSRAGRWSAALGAHGFAARLAGMPVRVPKVAHGRVLRSSRAWSPRLTVEPCYLAPVVDKGFDSAHHVQTWTVTVFRLTTVEVNRWRKRVGRATLDG
jgi:hypothetical protein